MAVLLAAYRRPLVLAAALALLTTPALAQACSGCGCKGGPGYRGPSGQCVGWAALDRTCGKPPTTHCKAEQVNARPGEDRAERKAEPKPEPKAERPRAEPAPRRSPPPSAPNATTRPSPF